MLPPFIIDQIRKREIEERSRQEQPQLELPNDPMPRPDHPLPDDEKRGVIIVELCGEGERRRREGDSMSPSPG